LFICVLNIFIFVVCIYIVSSWICVHSDQLCFPNKDISVNFKYNTITSNPAN